MMSARYIKGFLGGQVSDERPRGKLLYVLLADAPLTLRESVTHEPVPLASVFRELFLFLRDRSDAVVSYCEPARMTEDVDLLSTRARDLAEEIRVHLTNRLHIATRVREVAGGKGFRVHQVKKPRNRRLVDVRSVPVLPPFPRVDRVAVVGPTELTVMKTQSAADRLSKEKGLSDRLDLTRLLRTFPALKSEDGEVADRLRARGADARTLEFWRELARSPLAQTDGEDDEGDDWG